LLFIGIPYKAALIVFENDYSVARNNKNLTKKEGNITSLIT